MLRPWTCATTPRSPLSPMQSAKGTKTASKGTKTSSKGKKDVKKGPVENPLFPSAPKNLRIGGDVRVRTAMLLGIGELHWP